MYQFKVGDVVIPKKDIPFVDGSIHERGRKIIVGENEVAYYNHPSNNKLYDLYFSAPERDPTEREMIDMIGHKF